MPKVSGAAPTKTAPISISWSAPPGPHPWACGPPIRLGRRPRAGVRVATGSRRYYRPPRPIATACGSPPGYHRLCFSRGSRAPGGTSLPR